MLGDVTSTSELTLFAEEGTIVTNARLVIGRAAIAIAHVTAVVPRVERQNRSRPIAIVALGFFAILAAIHPALQDRFADLPGVPGVLLGIATLAVGAAMLVLSRPRHIVWVTTAHGQHVCALETRSRRRADRLSHAVAMAVSSRPLPMHDTARGTVVVERQVVVSRCQFCSALSPIDAPACTSCGAAR
jgi:ribosomal protein L40E